MALLDKGLKQRMVGALVLLALAVIFLPMLLTRQDDVRQVVVNAPAMPIAPQAEEIELQPVVVPEPQALADDVSDLLDAPQELLADMPEVSAPKAPEAPVVAPKTAPAPAPKSVATASAAPVTTRVDANSLPISWSVQLASLASSEGALNLQKTLRSQGYNAYVRTSDGLNRVFVGPLIERAEADRLRAQLNRQHKLQGYVVRFQPETR